jgi:hypothetical protein
MCGRLAACAVLIGVSALLVSGLPEFAIAQNKKENSLEKKIKSLQGELAQAAKQNAALRQELNDLRSAVKKDNKDDAKALKTMQAALDAYRNAGLIHVVILKAKPDTKPADVKSVVADSYSQLTKIKGVRGLWAGEPATNATPDASGDYTVALVLVFDNPAAVKAYLNDPIHDRFAEKHLAKWETPLVYDFVPRNR